MIESLVRLGELSTFLSGGTPRKGDDRYWSGGHISWLTPKDMGRWNGDTEAHVTQLAMGNGTRLAPDNAVFLAVRGMSLHNEIRLLRADREMSFNQDIKAIVPMHGISQAYLYYALQAQRAVLLGSVEASGHGTGTLPTAHIENLLIPRFGGNAEWALGELFAALDDKIELNRRMNETLEASARALFRDWFVDFGPTRAKAEGRPAYLAPDLWSLFPSRLANDGVPHGWEWSQLGQHVANFDSKRVPVSSSERAKRQGSYPYHGATSVMDYVDDYLFDGVFVLVGEDGSVARDSGHAFTQYVSGKIWVNNHAHVLQGKGAVSTEQIYLFFQHEPVLPFITGAVQMKLSQGRMNSMPFIDAGKAVCKNFSEVVGPLFVQIRANVIESRTLAETRDALLPKLMSGAIRVRDAERAVAA